MVRRIVNTKNAPEPIGPYNQAVVIDNLVYTSGQIPFDPETNNVCSGGITEQTKMVFSNLKAVLKEAGTSIEEVIKTTVFLKDMNDFVEMNNVYAEFFDSEQAPARSTVEVARLPKDVLVEIEVIANV